MGAARTDTPFARCGERPAGSVGAVVQEGARARARGRCDAGVVAWTSSASFAGHQRDDRLPSSAATSPMRGVAVEFLADLRDAYAAVAPIDVEELAGLD